MSSTSLVPELRQRVLIDHIEPLIDGGHFPVKRCAGDTLSVRATIHADGTDGIAALVRYRHRDEDAWSEAPLELLNQGKDLWSGRFTLTTLGRYEYQLLAWIDTFST